MRIYREEWAWNLREPSIRCLWVCVYSSVRQDVACVVRYSRGYRWHPIKESAGHLAIECSFKDPIVVMGRGGDQAYACVGCVSNRTCA